MNDTLSAVGARKQQCLIRAARLWITENSRSKSSYQFDVVGVSGGDISKLQNVIDA